MKLREMADWFAENSHLPDATIFDIARKLQGANLIKSGRRGRYGGADMDERDAAALLIALLTLNGRRGVVDAPETVRRVGSAKTFYGEKFENDPDDAKPIATQLFGLPSDHTIQDFIRAAIRHGPTPLHLDSGRPVISYEIEVIFPIADVATFFIPLDKSGVTADGVRWSVGSEDRPLVAYGPLGEPSVMRTPSEGAALKKINFEDRRTIRRGFFDDLHVQLYAAPENGGDDE